MSAPGSFVVAIIATAHRSAELAALLRSLAAIREGFGAVVVVDNGGEEETRAAVEASGLRQVYHAPGRNLGCGGGLAAGSRLALEHFPAELTHVWIMDDDAEVFPDALARLLDALGTTGAEMAYPMVEDRDGFQGWFPGLLDRAKFDVVRQRLTPEEFVRRCGPEPVPFSWANGVALLVTRGALERCGFHRTDYWVRGEDLEFSLRISWRRPGVFVPEARVRHLPPASASQPAVEYVRHAALLRNIAYTGLRLPHGRRIARTLPGNWWRFLRTWGPRPRVVWDLARGFWQGAILGRPAGSAAERRLKLQ